MIKSEYFASKSEISGAIKTYEKFKSENEGEDKDTLFYKDKLFKQMNSKMRVSQEKENLYQAWVKRANENLQYYTEKMQGLVKVYSQMQQERKQIMIDSLNKLVIFETSVQMTLKYDAKMFVKLIEETNEPLIVKEESKIQNKNKHLEKGRDNSKGDDETQSESKESQEKAEDNATLNEEYCEILSKFDQFGEYVFSEITDEEAETPIIHNPVKAKYEEEIYWLVQELFSQSKIPSIFIILL